MADHETIFNPLEGEFQQPAPVPGIKRPGTPMETHEATFADSHVIELDLDRYVDDFNRRVIGAYQKGQGSAELPADLGVARSLIPPGTGALRDFSYIAPEIPEFITERCVGCMTCVTECPDTAILGKAIPASKVEEDLSRLDDDSARAWVRTGYERANIMTCRKKKAKKARSSAFLLTRQSVKAVPSASRFAKRSITMRSRWWPKMQRRCRAIVRPLTFSAGSGRRLKPISMSGRSRTSC
jgi:ferredoxin